MHPLIAVAGKRFGITHAAAVAEGPRRAIAVADRNRAVLHRIRAARQAEIRLRVGSEGAGCGTDTILPTRYPTRMIGDRDLRRAAQYGGPSLWIGSSVNGSPRPQLDIDTAE